MSFDDRYGYNIIKNNLWPIFLEQNVSNEASWSSLLDLIDNYGCNCDSQPILIAITWYGHLLFLCDDIRSNKSVISLLKPVDLRYLSKRLHVKYPIWHRLNEVSVN